MAGDLPAHCSNLQRGNVRKLSRQTVDRLALQRDLESLEKLKNGSFSALEANVLKSGTIEDVKSQPVDIRS